MEDSLVAEREETLGYGKYDYAARTESGTTNSRNGEFEPRILPKNQTSVLTIIEIRIISMYAKGMTASYIQYHIKDIYDMDISDTTVSRITDKILPEARNGSRDRLKACMRLCLWTQFITTFAARVR